MKQYLITKTMTAQLIVNCETEAEAGKWSNRIVATLEDESGNPIDLQSEQEFAASSSTADTRVEIVE